MSAIQTLIHRISLKRSLYTQVLFTVFAFLLMVVLSYAFVNRITQNDLVRNTENILDFVENQINSDLTETQVILGGFAQTMRNMVMYGDDAEKIQKYIYSLSNYIHSREKNAVNPNGLYCYIEKEPYGHAVLCSVDTVLPQGYSLLDRPWYRTAVEAGGNIIETLPYRDAVTGNLIITYSCSIYDDEGGYLGVVCIDVQIDYIGDKVLHTALTKDGYGFLVAQDLTLLTHPNPDFVGLKMSEPGIPLSVLVDDMVSQEKVSEAPLINWKGESSIAFIRKFPNGWYLGLLALRDLYYQNAKNMALILSILGTALAAVLIIVLIRVDAAKNKSDMESRHKTAFLARVSHDIRTPMNAILGITEIQLQDKTLPQSAVEAFAKINNSGDLLIGLINDILDMSKIEAGKLELIPVQYDVPSLINDTVQLNILRFESKPIEFKLFVDENIPLSLIGDELRIKQILNNLLSNAFKYTERGIVSLAVTVDYTPQGESGSVLTHLNTAGAANQIEHGRTEVVPVVFRVSDTGQGMTEEQIRKLGDEYSRFNLEANRTTEGSGLGMSITRKLIELMNGGFSVKSEPGGGTTVTVRLPQENSGLSGTIGRKLADDLQKLREYNVSCMNKVQITRTPMPYGKVFIVDDAEMNLYVAKGLMAPYGLSIETAASGFEAIDKIKGGAAYDIIFMDHMMPKMDGIEAVKIIRDLGYKRPIIALTANALVGQAEMFMENGFDGFISKPIDIRQLNASLNKLIRDKYPPEVAAAALQAARDKAKPVEAQPPSDPKLSAMFVLDAEKSLARLNAIFVNEFRRKDDIRQYVIDTHTMKSALANIGESELSAAALKLEQAGRSENLAVMTAETPAFLEALREMIEKYRPKEEDGVIAQEETEDPAYLSEKLHVIQTACEKYDVAVVNTALAELGQKRWPRAVKKLLDTISEYLLNSDFEEAAKLVKDYIETKK